MRPRRAALALIGIGVAGCAAILGIDDRKLDTQVGDASADATADRLADASADQLVADAMGLDAGADRDAFAAEAAVADAAAADGANVDGPAPDGANGDAQVDANACADPCVLATGLNHPFLMTSDANNVYWTEFGDAQGTANGSVKSCPVGGCPPSGPLVYAPAQLNPRGIAVDGQNVYWASATYGSVNGAIWSCPLSGNRCSPTQLAPAGIPYGVAVDTMYVYWVDNSDDTVHRVLKSGGPDNVLYDGGGPSVVEPKFCVVDTSYVYFTDVNAGVYSLPVTGGSPLTIATGTGQATPLVVDTNYVYYGPLGGIFAIMKGTQDGGLAIASGIADPDGLVIDPATGTMYWSDFGSTVADDGTVGKVSTDGGGKVVLAASLVSPEAVTVSGSYVFWVSNGVLDDAGLGSGATIPSTGALYRRTK
jgi:hypothetical protein